MNFFIQISSCNFLLLLIVYLSATNIWQINAYSKKDLDDLVKICPATKEDMKICKRYQVPESETGKCFLKCAFVFMKMMKSSGKIDKEASAKAMIASWPKYSAELNTKISNKCYDQVHPLETQLLPGKPCELAYRLMKCLNVETRKYGYDKDFKTEL